MNDEYVRKDIYENDKDHILDLIADIHRRIEDERHSTDRVLAGAAIVIGIIQIGLAVMLYILR